MRVLQLFACVHTICDKLLLLSLVLNTLPASDRGRKAHLNISVFNTAVKGVREITELIPLLHDSNQVLVFSAQENGKGSLCVRESQTSSRCQTSDAIEFPSLTPPLSLVTQNVN